MNEPLRPMTLGEILDRTVQLYRRNFLLFAGSAAPPSAVMLAVLFPIGAVAGYFARSGMQGLSAHGLALGILFIAAVALLVPLELGATAVSQAALARVAVNANLGRKMKIRDAIASVWPRFWRYLGLLFLQGIFVGLIPSVLLGVGMVMLAFLGARGGGAGAGFVIGFAVFLLFAAAFVAFILLWLICSLAMPICVAEDKPVWASMQRSMQLTKGTRWRIFFMFLLIVLLSTVVSMLVYFPFSLALILVAALVHGERYQGLVLVASEIVNVVVNFAVQVLITPIYSTALVLFYFDQRIRTEGYDIEWMMEEAGLIGLAAPGINASSGPLQFGAITPIPIPSEAPGDPGVGLGS